MTACLRAAKCPDPPPGHVRHRLRRRLDTGKQDRDEEKTMPLYMDVHRKAPEGTKATDVADAHMADVKTQGKYGVQYLRYWFDEKNGKIFCLVDAPNPQAANQVHK